MDEARAHGGAARLPWPWLLALFVSYAYFLDSPSWNQNSRLALTRAIVEDGSVKIDRFHATTGDKSRRDGHFYSDKAPGVSWLCVPGYAAYAALRSVQGGEAPRMWVEPLRVRDHDAGRRPSPEDAEPGDRLRYNDAHRFALWLSRVLGLVPLACAGAFALWRLARHFYPEGRGAHLAAAVYAVGSPAAVYATGLYGHRAVGDLLLIAIACVVLIQRPSRSAMVLGNALGLAVACEYTAAIPALWLWLWAWRWHGHGVALRSAAWGAGWAGALAAYHALAFGSPFATGYDFVYLPEFAEGMRHNYGLGWPSLDALHALLFSSYRGLFYLCPALLLGAWGLVAGCAQHRSGAWALIPIALYYPLLNAGYYMWDGGAAFGPRHLVPAIGMLAVGLPFAERRMPLATRVSAGVGVVIALIGAASGPEAPQWGDPLWGHAAGRVLLGHAPSISNVGTLMGLPAALSVLPLLVLWWTVGSSKPPPRTADERTPG